MAANDYPVVLNGGPVDADEWFNPIAEDLTEVRATVTGQMTLVKRGQRSSDKTGIDGTERGILRVDNIPLVSGNRYLVLCRPSRFSPATATDICRHILRHEDIGAATTSSTRFAYAEIEGSKSETMIGEFTAGATSVTGSVLFSGQRATGVSATSWLYDSDPFTISVYDCGPDVGDSGVVL